MTADPTGRAAVLFGGKTGVESSTATNDLWAISSVGFTDGNTLVNIAQGKPVFHTYPRSEAIYDISNAVDGLTNTFASNG